MTNDTKKPSKTIIKNMFQRAATNGRLDDLKYAFSLGADPRYEDSQALMMAADGGHAECVEYLIPISDPKANMSAALRSAATNGHAECVELLIPVSDAQVINSLALSLASMKGHSECVKLLLPVSSPDDIPDALSAAATRMEAECVKLLIPACDSLATVKTLRMRGVEHAATLIETFLQQSELLSSTANTTTLSKNKTSYL